MESVRLPQSLQESGHLHFMRILPDLKHSPLIASGRSMALLLPKSIQSTIPPLTVLSGDRTETGRPGVTLLVVSYLTGGSTMLVGKQRGKGDNKSDYGE